MHKILLVPMALAIALPAASAAAAPAYFPISRCSVVDARTGEPLLARSAAAAGHRRRLVRPAGERQRGARRAGGGGARGHARGRRARRPQRRRADRARGRRRRGAGHGHGAARPRAARRPGGAGERRGGRRRDAIAVAVVGYFEAAATFAGTTGFIRTRPTCVPPKYTPDPLNYLQGPEPIQLPNGDVTLLVGAGRCCIGTRHWEGIFSLNYPAAGRARDAALPRPVGDQRLRQASPSARRRSSASRRRCSTPASGGSASPPPSSPSTSPNTDRASRIDLTDLITRATTLAGHQRLGQADRPGVRRTSPAAPGRGSGLDPVLTLHPNGDLFLYHRDGNYPACSSGFVRHHVVRQPHRRRAPRADGCVQLRRARRAPFLISDIARTARRPHAAAGREVRGAGLHRRVGLRGWARRDRPALAAHRPPLAGAGTPRTAAPWALLRARRRASSRTPSRTVVEPNVVVAPDLRRHAPTTRSSTSRLGRWYLYYWADESAVLPPTFGGPASSCALQGVQESGELHRGARLGLGPRCSPTRRSASRCSSTASSRRPCRPTCCAPTSPPPRGDGRHGFVWPIPAALKDRHRCCQQPITSCAASPTLDGPAASAVRRQRSITSAAAPRTRGRDLASLRLAT